MQGQDYFLSEYMSEDLIVMLMQLCDASSYYTELEAISPTSGGEC